jgi:hypothetical protein
VGEGADCEYWFSYTSSPPVSLPLEETPSIFALLITEFYMSTSDESKNNHSNDLS